VSVEGQWRRVVDVFARDLRDAIGWEIEIVDKSASPNVRIRRASDCGDEGYRLAIDESAEIEASESAGVAYALTMLRQLGSSALWATNGTSLDELVMPHVVIEDSPVFAWRGVHLDVARHFWSVATVCRLIDQIAAHRLNHLHLHLNDDQGWRVEIPDWPLLTSVGATRASSPVGHEDDGVDDHVAHTGYYSTADLLIIREHAARRFVTIVPEVDLPGHAQAAIAAYPALGNNDTPLNVWTRWGISDHVLNVSDVALDFASDAVRYVASLFPSSPVHIGGDECPTAEWQESDAAQRVMAQLGLDDVRELQGLFTQRMTRVLLNAGHEVVAWDEVLDADVAKEVVIAAWRHSDRGVLAAQRGHDVVMAPMQFLYFDWLSGDGPDEPVALAPLPVVTTWEKVYRFSVVPPGLEPQYHHHIRGAQAQLWTEYIATRDHLDYMAFPRLAVFSEVAWGTQSTLDEFRPRLIHHLDRLDAMDIHYRPLDDVT
jgi:hexosaminidase